MNTPDEFNTITQEFANVLAQLPFNRLIGLTVTGITAEQVTMHFAMRDELIGNFMHGILHGGVIASVLDMAGGAVAMVAHIFKNPKHSLNEVAAQLSKSGTINLHIDYLIPAKGNHFTAKASIIRSGNHVSFARMELFNDQSALVATGNGTYLVG